jgi:hypothetical protein
MGGRIYAANISLGDRRTSIEGIPGVAIAHYADHLDAAENGAGASHGLEAEQYRLTQRCTVAWSTEMPRSAIISSRSRKLRLEARYQRTHSKITNRSKRRPLKEI